MPYLFLQLLLILEVTGHDDDDDDDPGQSCGTPLQVIEDPVFQVGTSSITVVSEKKRGLVNATQRDGPHKQVVTAMVMGEDSSYSIPLSDNITVRIAFYSLCGWALSAVS